MSAVGHETLPRDARLIALLLASSPSITDAQPGVLTQLLEFAHRYTAQVLGDALVYADHAGRPGSVQMDDVTLAVQSRVGWEFGGRVPKEHILSLAAKTNAEPLPQISETYGVRLPPSKYCLTAVDFDLVPNKPPPQDSSAYQEEEEEEEEEDYNMDEDPRPDGLLALETGATGASSDTLGLSTGIRMEGEEENEEGAVVEEGGSDDDSGEGGDGLFDDDGEDDEEDMQMVDIQTLITPGIVPTAGTSFSATNGAPQA
ncbi:transcription initiation factor IID, 31kD subunit-domain-containing protein, partial [Cantharellus anzutake]|uniref:transcription initiation factor IID, 31kD subunit-domain-containing protein n=1 Tax=Cantharellus anzutake TaxID=1750568 RepID=UPI00190503BF